MAQEGLTIHKHFRQLLNKSEQSFPETCNIGDHEDSRKKKGKKKSSKPVSSSHSDEQNIHVIDPVFKTLEKRKVRKKVPKYLSSWPTVEIPDSPSVLLKDCKYPEECVDTKILTHSAAKVAKGISSQQGKRAEGKEEATGLPTPWRVLLKLPKLEKISEEPVSPEIVHSRKKLPVKKSQEEKQNKLERAKELLKLALEEGKQTQKSSTTISFVKAEGEQTSNKIKVDLEKEAKEKRRSRNRISAVTLPLEMSEENLNISPSEELDFKICDLLKKKSTENIPAVDYNKILTSEYLKKLVGKNPTLELPLLDTVENKEDVTLEFDPVVFRIKKTAHEILRKVLEGEQIEVDIMDYLCYSNAKVKDLKLLDELLCRIEFINSIEDAVKAKIEDMKELQKKKTWDEFYTPFLSYYLKDYTEILNMNSKRVELLQGIMETLQLLDYYNTEQPFETSYNEDSFCTGCEVNNLLVDQTLLYRMKHRMTEVPNIQDNLLYLQDDDQKPQILREPIPKANFVYICIEEKDPMTSLSNRNSNSFDKMSFADIYSVRPKQMELDEDDPYDEELAEIKYLQSKPICFILMGKDGAETRRLAQKIVEYWGCIHVDAENVIRAVVESGSKVGKWLDSLLQTGKKIPSHITFSLVLQRLNDHELHHYGYILTGFPYYGKNEKDPSPAQQLGQIFSLHLKPDIIIYVKFPDEDVIYKRNLQRFDPSSDTYISKDMEDIGRKVRFLYMHGKEQDQRGDIAEILQEFDLELKMAQLLQKTDIVKRTRDSTDPVSRYLKCYEEKVLPAIEELIMQFDPQYTIKVDGRSPVIQMFQIIREKILILPVNRPFKPIKMLPELVQLSATIDAALKHEEEEEEEEEEVHRVEEEEEDEAIKASVNEDMLEDEIKVEDLEGLELDEETLKEINRQLEEEEEEMESPEPNLEDIFKLKCQKFYGSEELIKETEGSIDEDDPAAFYWNKTPPEVFTTLKKKDALGGRFKWKLSHWNYFCPIELVQGRAVQGKLKHAVRFLDKIYFMSSPEAEKIFIQNPRPYLVPPNPIPTCRVFIMGHRLSGKTTLAMHIAKLFQGKVISFKTLCAENVAQNIKKLQDVYLPDAILEAVQIINERRKKEMEEDEEQRLQHIEEWKADMDYILREIILSYETLRDSSTSKELIIEDHEFDQFIEVEDVDADMATLDLLKKASVLLTLESLPLSSASSSDSWGYSRSEILELLARHKLPPEPNMNYLERLLSDEEELMKYLPRSLRRSLESNYSQADENHPEVIQMATEKVREIDIDTVPDVDWEAMPIYLAQTIYDTESERSESTGGAFKYGGWVVDDIPPDAALIGKLKEFGIRPDLIICLRDEDPDYKKIISLWEDKIVPGSDVFSYNQICEIMACDNDGKDDHYIAKKQILSEPRNYLFSNMMDFVIFSKTVGEELAVLPDTSDDIEICGEGTYISTLESDLSIMKGSGSVNFEDEECDLETIHTTEGHRSMSSVLGSSCESAVDQEFSTIITSLTSSFPNSSLEEKYGVKAVDADQTDALAYFCNLQYGSTLIIETFGAIEESSTTTFIDKDIADFHQMLDLQGEADVPPVCNPSEINPKRKTASILKISRKASPTSVERRTPSVRFEESVQLEEQIQNFPSEVINSVVEDVYKELHLFDTTYEFFKDDIAGVTKPPIEINVEGKSLTDILKEGVSQIVDMFRVRPEVINKTEGEEYEEGIEEEEKVENEEEIEPEELGEEAVQPAPIKLKEETHLGDTGIYCPIEFVTNFVLWPGQKKYGADFHGKKYLMSTEDVLEKFLHSPEMCAPFSNPPTSFPPPRLCIVGTSGSGTTEVSELLSKRMGLPCINFMDLVIEKILTAVQGKVGYKYEDSYDVPSYDKDEMLDESIKVQNVVRNYLNEGTPLPYEYLDQVLVPLWASKQYKSLGFILNGFPHGNEDVEYMVQASVIPDIIIELDVNHGIASQNALEDALKDWQLRLEWKKRKFIEEVVALEEERQRNRKAYTIQILTRLMLESGTGYVDSDTEEWKVSSSKLRHQGGYHMVIDNTPVYYTVDEKGEVQIHEKLSIDVIKRLQKSLPTIQEESELKSSDHSVLLDEYYQSKIKQPFHTAGLLPISEEDSERSESRRESETLETYTGNKKLSSNPNNIIPEEKEIDSELDDVYLEKPLSTIQEVGETAHTKEMSGKDEEKSVVPEKKIPHGMDPLDVSSLSDTVLQNVDYTIEDYSNADSSESGSKVSVMALKSLSIQDGTENLKFIPIEFVQEWFQARENKSQLNMEISQSVNNLFPPTKIQKEWETTEEAKERLEAEVQSRLDLEFETIEIIRNKVKEHNIPWMKIEAEKTLDEIIDQIMHFTSHYRYRRNNIFENVCAATLKEAETLLKNGYYFLSKFGYWCPVQVYEKEIPVQMYIPGSQRGDIYPIIHRRYIYFISGPDNKEKFQKDPLKYITQEDPYCPLFPIRVAVIGPPKCGKTTLSEHLANYFTLKIITPGSALRYVLEDLGWCHLAKQIQTVLEDGEVIPDSLVVQAIEAAAIEPRCSTQGFIIDGFPDTTSQCEELAKKNLTPFLIIHLQSKRSTCFEHWERTHDEDFRIGFKYSQSYMNFKYSRWSFKNNIDWMQEAYQNVLHLDTTKSKWWLFTTAKLEILRVMKTIILYLKNVDKAVVPLKHLCVTSQEFEMRKHPSFDNYCPVCMKKDGVFTCSKIMDRNGLLQYKKYYYWVCEDHCKLFFEMPEDYTPPCNNAHLPHIMPEPIKLTKGNIDEANLSAGGFCVVTYLVKQPYGRLVKGQISHAIKYKGKIFLFCSDECYSEFMKCPTSYCDLQVHWKVMDPLPPIQLNKLPTMGYLEQTLVGILNNAITLLAKVRPKSPGLDAKTSAAIFVGLYLKVHNINTPLDILELYEKAYRHFYEKLKFMKSMFEVASSQTDIWKKKYLQKPPASISGEDVGGTDKELEGKPIEERSTHSSDEDKLSKESSEKIGPCGYEYPTGSGDYYMGDYYMEVSGCDSSYDSILDSTYDPNAIYVGKVE